MCASNCGRPPHVQQIQNVLPKYILFRNSDTTQTSVLKAAFAATQSRTTIMYLHMPRLTDQLSSHPIGDNFIAVVCSRASAIDSCCLSSLQDIDDFFVCPGNLRQPNSRRRRLFPLARGLHSTPPLSSGRPPTARTPAVSSYCNLRTYRSCDSQPSHAGPRGLYRTSMLSRVGLSFTPAVATRTSDD